MDRLTLDALKQSLLSGAKAQGDMGELDLQRERANSLRDTPLAQGGRRSGYVSPFMIAANTAQRLSGEREGRRIGKERKGLSQAVAQAGVDQTMFDQQTAADATARKQFVDDRGFNQKAEQFGLTHAANRADAAFDQSRTGKPETWIDLSKPEDDPARVINAIQVGEDQWINQGTKQPLDLNNHMRMSDWAGMIDAKDKSALAKAKGGDPMAQTPKPDIVSSVITDKNLEAGTGLFDPRQWLGRLGIDMPVIGKKGEGEKIQQVQGKMADIGLDAVKSNLEGLGAQPTDKDMDVAFASIPDRFSQPSTWVVWARDMYLPMLDKAFVKAEKAGTLDKPAALKYYNQVKESIAQGEAMWIDKKPPAAAPDADPVQTEIDMLKARIKAGGG
jgi:hypothetical protein